MFRGSVKSTGYPLRSPISPSLPLLSVTVCHHISTGLYYIPHMVPNQEEFYEHIYVRFSDFVFAAIASIEVLTDIFFLFCIIRLCEARWTQICCTGYPKTVACGKYSESKQMIVSVYTLSAELVRDSLSFPSHSKFKCLVISFIEFRHRESLRLWIISLFSHLLVFVTVCSPRSLRNTIQAFPQFIECKLLVKVV